LIEIKRATPNDAGAIQSVKDAVWPHDSTSEDYIHEVLSQSIHVAHLAEVDGIAAGIVSGFLTTSAEGIRRWEVDLLAVHPDFRNQGIASRLIQANLGQVENVSLFRALIQVENIASQVAFARCDFKRDADKRTLYISTDAPSNTQTHVEGLHLIPVMTLNYCGVWLEGELNEEGFRLAQAVRAQHDWDVAGALISQSRPDTMAEAEACGYSRVSDFEWWTRSVAAPAPL
jgi:GNAT superfamily N-acetyltransferase